MRCWPTAEIVAISVGEQNNAVLNEGTHTIHTGGQYDSHLLVPVVR